MSHYDTIVHLVAGGLGGTIGAIATCPLEVVKTRLQSSVATFTYPVYIPSSSSAPNGTTPTLGTVTSQRFHMCTCICTAQNAEGRFAAVAAESSIPRQQSFGIWRCLRHIVETEGTRALFKGLGPNLVGVAPSRAIYFCTYSHTKNFCNSHLTPDTPMVHICSAASAGFMSCTLTNPVWFVKTRLQLDQRKYGSTTAWQCIRDIYATKGVRGFYKGITASYFGISETVIHFVIYEFLKSKLHQWRAASCYELDDEKTTRDFLEYMLAGAISKTCASSMTYPHEVARTRLRQEGDKYRSFFQTLLLVFREEGIQGLYRGLGTQLVRQIPNTAIMMATYEAVVYLLTPTTHLRHAETVPLCADDDDDDDDGC